MIKEQIITTHQTAIAIVETGLEPIFAFKEKPGKGRIDGGPDKVDGFGASELFSMFTADIIRQNVKFTR